MPWGNSLREGLMVFGGDPRGAPFLQMVPGPEPACLALWRTGTWIFSLLTLEIMEME